MTNLFTTHYKITFLRLLIYITLISFPLFGSDCNNNVIGGGTSGNIVGNWQLTYITGYRQDVCLNEIVKFQSNDTVILQCPNEQPITRTYTVSNNVLTYSTGVKYDITTLTNTTLVLEGLNNLGRTLTYVRLPADYLITSGTGTVNHKNSPDF